MKNNKWSLLIPVLLPALVWVSCSKSDDYKKYIPGQPIVYPGKADSIIIHPGNNRVMLSWLMIADPTITSAKVFWNNRSDSASIDINRTSGVDTIKIMIPGLQETAYTFEVFTYDKKGNRSVPAVVTGKAYGDKYHGTLLNRGIQGVNYSPADQQVTVNWGAVDTVNTDTKIWYTDATGNDKMATVKPEETTSVFSWLVGSRIYYQSSYMPTSKAVDTFTVLKKDSISIKNVPVPKDGWAEVDMPNDIATNAYGTDLSWIWDGKPGDYPEIYHTDGSGMPHHFTLDMGGLYNVSQFEEIGRVNDNPYHNPTRFEVWGIADITNAATTLPAGDPGWAQESIDKGWTLLTNIERPDNGTAPYKVDLLPNIPAVRYIRIRVLETNDHDVDSHMSEITFWYNP